MNPGNCSVYSFPVVLSSFLPCMCKSVLSGRLQGGPSVERTVVSLFLSLPFPSLSLSPFSGSLSHKFQPFRPPRSLISMDSSLRPLNSGFPVPALHPGDCLQAVNWCNCRAHFVFSFFRAQRTALSVDQYLETLLYVFCPVFFFSCLRQEVKSGPCFSSFQMEVSNMFSRELPC